jgi:hypothetical protein
VVADVTTALAGGMYADDAARLAGIAPSTLYGWLRRGRLAEAEHDTTGAKLCPDDAPFVELLEAVERARSQARRAALEVIRSAAEAGTWQAAAWYLERTAPDKYGRGAGPRHPVNAEPSPTAEAQRATELDTAAGAAAHNDAVLYAALGLT